ncbi:MAG: diacylglycerol kinase (ATP) [Bacteroidia bacterium]|jgi:diacylglycerol kinase (ATP)
MKRYLDAFGHAFNGIGYFIRNERNAKVHLGCTVVACTAGWLFSVNLYDWALIISAITIVLIAEMFNSTIEKTLNLLHPEKADAVKVIKDLAAAAVLIASFYAVAIAFIVFGPLLYRII